jgi:vancomycin resistance protein VanW
LSLRTHLRNAAPLALRRRARLFQRSLADWRNGAGVHAPEPADVAAWPCAAEIRQALGTTPHSDAKRHNIALAAAALSGRPVAPGGLFSFWGWLGEPSQARGFEAGRALRGDRLVLETGGGLCQLAGAVYYAGLQAGLTVAERHAHSADLYTDETRYAPLGSDATVSYGFKDLRLRNPHSFPVAFGIDADAELLRVRVLSARPLARVVPEFKQERIDDGHVAVETWVNGALASRTTYGRLMP